MKSLTLTSQQIVDAVRELEGETLPVRTLAEWADAGIVRPSVRWVQRRGRANARLYNLSDLARVRLIVRLRREGVSMPRVRAMLAYLDAELRDVLRPRTRAQLVLDGYKAVIVYPQRPPVEIPSGQLRLDLSEVLEGNRETAERMTA